MKVLLTGSNGFVGSRIAKVLSDSGNEVTCLLRKTSNKKWLKDMNVELFYGDVCHEGALFDIISKSDAIVHSAGILRAKDERSYFKVNQEGTRNLVDAALRFNPHLKKFIYISSQAAMGPSKTYAAKPADEPEDPVSDYGKSKLAGEKEVKALHGHIPYTILRPASIYGPRDKDIFIFFNLVKLGIRPRTLKKRYFQMLFVDDLAKAVQNCLANAKSDNRTYFLAEDRFFSWEDIGQTIADSIGKKTISLPLPDFVLRATAFFSETTAALSGNTPVLNRQKIHEMTQDFWLGDNTAAKADLLEHFTKLENGAKITYSWYKSNKWL